MDTITWSKPVDCVLFSLKKMCFIFFEEKDPILSMPNFISHMNEICFPLIIAV